FLIAALLWFPWIFSTAAILLLFRPVHGVVQPAIAWWYAHNLSTVFLGFAGLASTLYFIPKLLGRPLYSRQLAGLTFWGLALFGGCGGIPDGAPLPSWVASLAVIGSVFMLLPMLALGDNLRHTVRQQAKPLDADPTLRFTYAGVAFLFIAIAQQIVGALPHVSQITSLTWYGVAQKEFLHLGFFAMTIFGAMYYIVPRLLGLEASAWCPKLAKWHFILSVAGILISGLSLMVAGIQQGILLSEPGHSFVDVMRSTLMPLRMSTLGDLFFLAGACNFLANFSGCVGTWCCQWRAKLKEAR
ncbi:MAG TPA: cbb3-type cytochrome c oxidase subunit I, partial [Verrucomicrobiae bacterium]